MRTTTSSVTKAWRPRVAPQPIDRRARAEDGEAPEPLHGLTPRDPGRRILRGQRTRAAADGAQHDDRQRGEEDDHRLGRGEGVEHRRDGGVRRAGQKPRGGREQDEPHEDRAQGLLRRVKPGKRVHGPEVDERVHEPPDEEEHGLEQEDAGSQRRLANARLGVLVPHARHDALDAGEVAARARCPRSPSPRRARPRRRPDLRRFPWRARRPSRGSEAPRR